MSTSQEIIKILKKRNQTIATMESCTGGALISELTDIQGSSEITHGGYVTYSNEQKIRIGVPDFIVHEFGVYSQECAKSMAMVAREVTGSSIGIGVTGTFTNIDTSNKDSEQGVVHYAIVSEDFTEVRTINVSLKERKEQKQSVVNEILKTLLDLIGQGDI